MKKQNPSRRNFIGASMALAAAALFVTACAGSSGGSAFKAKLACSGINSCRGESQCATAQSACLGENGCKGQGWGYADSAEDCRRQGGVPLPGKG